MFNKRGYTLIEIIVTIIFFGIMAALLSTMLFGCSGYSEGERIGHVVKLSKKGIINKTWEGELNIGVIGAGTSKGNPGGQYADGTWHFSIKDQRVVETLQAAMQSNKRVSIFYDEAFARWPGSQDTKYTVVRAKILD